MMLCLSVLSAGCANKVVPAGIEYCSHTRFYCYADSDEIKKTPVPVLRFIDNNNDRYVKLCKPKRDICSLDINE